MKKVSIYTDGACSGNPGKGGWGAVLAHNGYRKKKMSGYEAETTNNRMELTAVIRALAALREPCLVTLTTDSKYVCDAVTKGWVYGWQRKGWRKADGKPALNVDLWQQLLPLLQTHTVTFNSVKGHAGHPYNERCDSLGGAGKSPNTNNRAPILLRTGGRKNGYTDEKSWIDRFLFSI